MTAALVRRNLRHLRGILTALAVGVTGMQVLLVRIATGFDEGLDFDQLLQALPPFVRAFIGSQIGELSFGPFVGFGFQHPVVLSAGIAWVAVAATGPAAERESGLADLWLARPLSRASYLTASLATMAVGALVLPTAQLVGASIGLAIVRAENEPPWWQFAPTAAGQATLLLCFGGIALLCASAADRRGTAVARTVGVALVTYVIEAFGRLWAPLGELSWLSPFHWFRPLGSAPGGSSWGDGTVLVVLGAVASALAYTVFSKRDL